MLTDCDAPAATAANSPANDHSRTIVHIDVDCFYAQVEELLDPTLRSRPLGIQQKNIIVTCNYAARARGVGKLQLLSEALRICPDLVLVLGEDLTKYRRMSAAIFDVLVAYHGDRPAVVERLGMDENYVDVSALVAQRQHSASGSTPPPPPTIEGFVYPPDEPLIGAPATADTCGCGCAERLAWGTAIARELRDRLHAELGITACAGIAHNKLLAKWVGSRNKPNAQTVLVPWLAAATMRQLAAVRQLCGIGERTEQLLRDAHVTTVAQLQDVPLAALRQRFGPELAGRLKDWSYGRDAAPVKASGAAKSIGLEDACRSMTVRADCEEKFRLLLLRLVEQALEDGRVPLVLRITVRKVDAQRRGSHRETRQANIAAGLFRQMGDGRIVAVQGVQEALLKLVMRLFERAVDLRRPFNITLLGLAFCKFQERRTVAGGPGGAVGAAALGGGRAAGLVAASRSMANFLIRRSADVEVQSVTSLSSEGFGDDSGGAAAATTATGGGSDMAQTPRYVTSSPMHMDYESISDTSHASCSSDVSESEVEPSPKKTRTGAGVPLLAKRRCLQGTSSGRQRSFDASSPSKLRVDELRLGGAPPAQPTSTATSPHRLFYPTSPLASLRSNVGVPVAVTSPASPPPTSTPPMAATAIVARLPADCPPSVDAEVFGALPLDVQEELLAQWRSAAAVQQQQQGPNGSGQMVQQPTTTQAGPSGAGVAAAATAAAAGQSAAVSKAKANNNTLHRYFIANPQ